jgi:hypothetical protein
MWERSINDPDGFWLEQAEDADLVQEAHKEPAVHLGHRPARSSTPGSPTASSMSRTTAWTATSAPRSPRRRR